MKVRLAWGCKCVVDKPWTTYGQPVDNSPASYPQADTQVAHSLPTTDHFDTATGYLYFNFSDHCLDNAGPHFTGYGLVEQ